MESKRDNQPGDFIEKVIQIKRVSKKTKGGNQISFTALVVVGDRKGRVGYALDRARDVSSAIRKAARKAKNRMISIPLESGTITQELEAKFKAAKVLLKPAKKGTGLIAGSSVRVIAEVAGIEDIVAKMMGSKNKVANVAAVFKAFSKIKKGEKNGS
jgi:small subunit ribosomal protein S5